MHTVKVLIDISEWALGQIENGLNVEHAQLEVVSVEQVCHVAQKQTILLDFRGEAGAGSDLSQLCNRIGVPWQTEERIFGYEPCFEVFHAKDFMDG